MSDADKKALKVKTGVVKRLGRELLMYQEEVQAEQAKVQRLKDQAADSHDIKYAVSGEANRRHTDLILQAAGA
jgi:tubulin-specific chaperone A